jgi:hypothetical protein
MYFFIPKSKGDESPERKMLMTTFLHLYKDGILRRGRGCMGMIVESGLMVVLLIFLNLFFVKILVCPRACQTKYESFKASQRIVCN